MTDRGPLDGLPAALNWPEGMTRERFLAEHWQRQPLYLPNALPGIADLLDADEFAGLACEPGIESRLIICAQDASGAEEWALEQGPFEDARFAALPDTGWTLLVQDVEKHLPELAGLFERFGFVPSWRMDDLMVSYAAPGGSVGAHVDGYDVFLIQGRGARTWMYGEGLDPEVETPTIPDRPLQQLSEFEPVATLEMTPGDVLYLPPGVPHHGISTRDCMTWSIGFRAPARGQLAVSLLRNRLEATDSEALFADPSLTLDEADAGLISAAAVQRAREFMAPVSATADLIELTLALGATVTTPKEWLRPVPPEELMDMPALRQTALSDGLTRHGFALLARSEAPTTLFACGIAHSVEDIEPKLIRDLCSLRELSPARLATLTDDDWVLLGELYRDGILLTITDLDDDSS